MSAIIDKTIETINAGWGQLALYDESTDSYCINGALGKELTGLGQGKVYANGVFNALAQSKEIKVIADVIREQYPDKNYDISFNDFDSPHRNISTISTFNDDGRTTKEDVIRVLEKANVELDSQI